MGWDGNGIGGVAVDAAWGGAVCAWLGRCDIGRERRKGLVGTRGGRRGRAGSGAAAGECWPAVARPRGDVLCEGAAARGAAAAASRVSSKGRQGRGAAWRGVGLAWARRRRACMGPGTMGGGRRGGAARTGLHAPRGVGGGGGLLVGLGGCWVLTGPQQRLSVGAPSCPVRMSARPAVCAPYAHYAGHRLSPTPLSATLFIPTFRNAQPHATPFPSPPPG